jgi:hypothetical protein
MEGESCELILLEPDMPKEIYPSSYECDCGHLSSFLENTIREAKARSLKRRIYLKDSEREEHTIVFSKSKMIDILCPNKTNTMALHKEIKACATPAPAESGRPA